LKGNTPIMQSSRQHHQRKRQVCPLYHQQPAERLGGIFAEPVSEVDATSYVKKCCSKRLQNGGCISLKQSPPCGGIEYLHRDPASHRRRRKGKSQICDSKIWSQVPRDLDPRKTALARASNTYKRQTRPLVREGAPQEQDRNCHTSNKYLVVIPRWVLCSKTDWPTDRRS
jgi:hypothetical protein